MFRRYQRLGSREKDYAGDTQPGAWKVEAVAQGEREGREPGPDLKIFSRQRGIRGGAGGLRTQRGDAQQGTVLREEEIGRQNDETKQSKDGKPIEGHGDFENFSGVLGTELTRKREHSSHVRLT